MTSHKPPDPQPSALAGDAGRGHDRRPRWPAVSVRAVAYAACGWCLVFAGVSAWQVATSLLGHPGTPQRFAADSTGLAIIGALVGVIKLVGATVALAAVRARPGLPGRQVQLLGVALWGAFGLLALYSAGNLVIAVGTVSGLLAPSAAWIAAGGVTAKAIGYVLYFLAGSVLFGVLTLWFHRRHRLRWTSAVAGLAGAPLLLGLLLAVAPAILSRAGLFPV